jgi:urease accessory protein
MLIFTERLSQSINTVIHFDLALTAEQRTRSRQSIELPNGQQIYLRLPRGILLMEGDLLKAEKLDCITKIIAQPEPVITVFSQNPLDLTRAAYHLGNRHIAIEITSNYLRFSPDPVLESMVKNLGLNIKKETAPFSPEPGAYHSHH